MTASSPKPRRWFSLRFSLAGLLLFMTASAVAVWVWTWPYEEVTTLPGQQGKLITTWKRTFTGGRVRHGLERLKTNQFERTRHYRDGQLHGPYVFKHAAGSETKGQYEQEEREGTWTTEQSDLTQTAQWRRGQLDGTLEIRFKDGEVKRYTFAHDRLIDKEGNSVLLVDDKRMPAIDVAPSLSSSFVNTPLEDVVAHFAAFHRAPAKLDPRVPRGANTVTQSLHDIGLVHALQILAVEHDLQCRVHDGAIWLEPRGER